ncbi:MAG: hypothetical protein ACXWR4_03600 [Bdellovibrionota bacterium]
MLLAALFSIFLTTAAAHAMNLEGATQSKNIVDRQLDENSSPYRKAVVHLSESLSAVGYVEDQLRQDNAPCDAILALRPKVQQLDASLKDHEPLWELPDEAELSGDPHIIAEAAGADACSGSFGSVMQMVKEKYKKLEAAADTLKAKYGISRQQADVLKQNVDIFPFEGCYSTNKKVAPQTERGRRGNPMKMALNAEAYRKMISSGLDAHIKAYDEVVKALQNKATYLQGALSHLQQSSTLKGGGARCSTIR